MGSSANRRSGNSRRAQYTTFFSYVAGGATAAIGAVLLIISFVNPSAFAWLRGWGNDVTRPISSTAAEGKAKGQDFLGTITGFFMSGSENARMHEELQQARIKLIEANAVKDENRRLKALLAITNNDPKPVAAARLVGSSSSSTRRFATVDAGASNGVEVGMPVRSDLGVIGRILEVAHHTARVLLITDTESVVPIKRAADGIPAFAEGKGDGTLRIRLISLGINPLKPGDLFVTSGSGGLYHPNIPIAVVRRVTSDGAVAAVLSDPGATEYVVIDKSWSPEAATAASVPAPTPSEMP